MMQIVDLKDRKGFRWKHIIMYPKYSFVVFFFLSLGSDLESWQWVGRGRKEKMLLFDSYPSPDDH